MADLWQEWVLEEEHEGERLVNVLDALLANRHSKRQVKRAIERGQCQRNGKPELLASALVHANDYLRVNVGFIRSGIRIPTFEDDRILYEDEYMLAYDKPPYLSSDRDGICALFQVDRPGLELGHRLDTDTSGVLLFAKSRGKLSMIQDLFRRRQMYKSYLCLVEGVVARDKGRIENFLGPVGQKHGKVIRGELPADQGGKLAVTEWNVVARGAGVSLVQCFPETGRTHQIRIHMLGIGHPILGDYRYEERYRSGCYPPRHMLHAHVLRFFHPKTAEALHIEAAIPDDFIEAAGSRGIDIPRR